jgi:hypothetical protein
VGPVVISELHNHPDVPTTAARLIDLDIDADDLEFVEIHNPTDAAVDLSNWRIRGGIEFDFGPATSLGSGQTILVLPFNPDSTANARTTAAFRTQYGLVETPVPLVGGYQGRLSNTSERVQLQRPDPSAGADAPVSYVLEDEVLYDDRAPWPTAQNLGDALVRSQTSGYGNSPASWTRAAPSPGSVDFVLSRVIGDSNEDGVFNELDIVQVLQAGKYRTGQPADFGEGDWNGDGFFNQLDVVMALQRGSYSS